jgi:flagellar basal-body rod protein FlgB
MILRQPENQKASKGDSLRPERQKIGASAPLTASKHDWRAACIVPRVLDAIAFKLEHYMDLLGKRQQLVAANIANADTPGYKTKDIDFQFEFMSLIEGGSPNVVEAPGLAAKNDGNNVNMERESRLLAENALRFNLASSLMRAQIRSVRSAIQEGK